MSSLTSMESVVKPATRRAGSSSVDQHLVSFLKPDSFEANQYKALRYGIDRVLRSTPGCRIVAVTSPTPGDGKTITTINLAGAISRNSQSRVLIIDADMRHPSVAEAFGRKDFPRRGLVDAVMENRPLQEFVHRLETKNVSVLTARPPDFDTDEILGSPNFARLLEEAAADYDYVLVDTPPVLPVPDCRLLAEHVHGFVVVVGADKTPRALLEETLEILGPSKVLGLVLNREQLKHSRYGNQYYRSYPGKS